MTARNSQIKYYCELMKDNEILLLKSKDAFFQNHYTNSPLNVLTNFSGSEGEAIIEKNGKITLFVDTRYHLLVDKQAYSDINIYKMDLGETFFDAFKKCYKKNTIMHVHDDILLKDYMKFSEYFDLRKYSIKKQFLKNLDFKKASPIFSVQQKIEKQNFSYKIQKLRKIYPKVDKMLIFDLDCISYLTGLRSFQTNYSSNVRSILYLDFKNSSYTLFLDKIPKIKIENLKFDKLKLFKDFIRSIDEKIWLDVNAVSLENFLAVKKPSELKQSKIALMASIKPKSLISNLIEANKKIDEAIFNFKNNLKTGLSEVQLVEMLEQEIFKTGAGALSFKTILALDENTASIHYSSYDDKKFLKNESLILIDCGAYYENGYATDITRTLYFGKNPKKIQKTIYTAVLKAFLNCYLSKETNAKELDLLARKYLDKYNKEGFYFNHGLGHGIGTSCHQNPPRLSMTSKDIIKPYQTHSIEPGLYGKDKKSGLEFGVRLENCVYSDLNYQKISLSNFPFEEILIDYELLNAKEKNALAEWQNKVLNICRQKK